MAFYVNPCVTLKDRHSLKWRINGNLFDSTHWRKRPRLSSHFARLSIACFVHWANFSHGSRGFGFGASEINRGETVAVAVVLVALVTAIASSVDWREFDWAAAATEALNWWNFTRSCLSAYSNILMRRTRSFLRFSWPRRSPSKNAIRA